MTTASTSLPVADDRRFIRNLAAGMALILVAGFVRLLPMPLLPPYAFEIAGLAALVFPAIAVLYDWRTHGRPHPAWFWGIGMLIGATLLARVIGFSPVDEAVYEAVVAGTPLAGTSGLGLPPPPGPPPGAT